MKKSASTLPPLPPAPAQAAPIAQRSPLIPQLHASYRIHWRTEINWRAAHIEFVGHLDLPSLTPETACETFADKFPDREIIRLVAL